MSADSRDIKTKLNEELDSMRKQKQTDDYFRELNYKENADQNTFMQGLEQKIGEARQKYNHAQRNFTEATSQHNRVLSTENISAMMEIYSKNFIHIGRMHNALLERLLTKAFTIAYKTATNPEVLPIFPMIVATINKLKTDNRTPEPLPAAIIPYFTEVTEEGVLSFDLPRNYELSKEDHLKFNDNYKQTIKDAVIEVLTTAKNTDGESLYNVDTSGHIVTIKHASTGQVITPDEFSDFRQTVLTAELTEKFKQEFRPVEGSSPAP
jgi:hypothetical protein